MYVDGKGEVCSLSSAFTFSAPKPLEELVTLEQGLEGGEGSEDMLVVIPKAELLQVRTLTLTSFIFKCNSIARLRVCSLNCAVPEITGYPKAP